MSLQVGKRDREDDMEDSMGGPEEAQMSKDDAMQAAMASVRALAKSAQMEAMQQLQRFQPELDAIWEKFAALAVNLDIPPGDQPIVIILKVLRRILGARWTEVTGGASLLAVLGSMDTGTCDEETRQQLQEFVDKDVEDWRTGPHLGGECENALLEWVDSCLTLLTV
mmetsp:Transcript_31977/g.76435  ORF Transcript_31977/g.76435 Transcript_31977/m.76435 type:complete len:167 (-) Transcript_31977:63-563(-)